MFVSGEGKRAAGSLQLSGPEHRQPVEAVDPEPPVQQRAPLAAALFEAAIIVNRLDEGQVRNPTVLARMAAAVAEAVRQF